MKTTPVAMALVAVFILGGCSSQSRDDIIANSDTLTWHAITFGQSTDLNFGSTILPEKVGINQVTVDGRQVSSGPVAPQFMIESRGGKLANSHEGGTFYYTQLPTDVNFTLSANVVLNQLGPETGALPNRQEGAGLMVRDVIGKPRMDPQPQGQEEFPAASNMVMNIIRANEKGDNGLVNIGGNYREGIYEPWGTAGNRMSRTEYIQGVPFGSEQTYRMTLSRSDNGYTVSYANGQTHKVFSLSGANANIVEMQDPKHQYVGFFASRNAKITVSDVQLTLTPAATPDAPRYHAQLVQPIVQPASPDISVRDNYTLQARANYSGVYRVTQDGSGSSDAQQVNAGDMFDYNATLANRQTQFTVVFTPTEGPDLTPLTYQQTVIKQAMANRKEIVVNPHGTNGHLTLQQAVNILPAGGTIVLQDGDYPALTIPVKASGTPEHRKTLRSQGQHARIAGQYLHEASYWRIANIEVDGGQLIVHGSHNEFDKMVTHDAPDTGFQISSPSNIGRALWASYNIVKDSESYNNMDKGQINADGFAVKMRVGDGNTLISCVSHHNIDDGYDLFNKVEDGPNGAVTIIDSVAYMNGQTLHVKAIGGTRGNGFKLGGEGLPVPHTVTNSLAFHNNMDGFTDNFNPGALTLQNNVAIDNKRFNYLFRKSPYTDDVKQGAFTSNESYRFYVSSQYNDVVNGETLHHNRFIQDGKTRDEAGNVVTGDRTDSLRKASQVQQQANIPGQQAVQQIRAIVSQ
ncbi:right-handed parallel beta-helix repeat-containing protein [Vibrio palustris]|uniref:Pectate disaccharide-lyase n=1 Tax=Vibrio palustris TaxID=1918946 RepID=A0A1R4B5T5_9VIBR|nr:exopolygalacturonate lyase [Vibrio palustris]SJL84275.1 Pectate disaccharide-lyase precursor [Vibrio palustris]